MASTASAEDSNRPLDTAVRQQRMIAWNPILHPVWVIVTLFAMSVAFIPIGLKLNNVSDSIVEYSIKYDSYDPDAVSEDSCGIDGIKNANQGVNCQIQFNVKEDMAGPVMVYYEIENFHQNYRAYEQSRDDYQVRWTNNSKIFHLPNILPFEAVLVWCSHVAIFSFLHPSTLFSFLGH